MPASAREWFTRDARDGYEWVCKNGVYPEEMEIKKTYSASSVCDLIDTAAGNTRKRLASPGWGIETEYRHTYEAAVEYLSSDDKPAPLPVQTHAKNNQLNHKEAAKDIVKKYKRANHVVEMVYDIRMDGKTAVKAAAKEAPDSDLMAIAQPFIDRLNELKVT